MSEQNGNYYPVKVNFYIHEGGKSYYPSECWWSPACSNTYYYLQQGLDENHTHLHVWIAANSHASYNRYSQVYKSEGSVVGIGLVTYVDKVDYSPTSYNLYFSYNHLVKFGEVLYHTPGTCPDSGYELSFHSYPAGSNSKHWLSYRGRAGDFEHSGSPFMPPKECGSSHEWLYFSTSPIFGFTGHFYGVAGIDIGWISDNSVGD